MMEEIEDFWGGFLSRVATWLRLIGVVLAALVLMAVLLWSGPASAQAKWVWDCSRGVPCRQVPVGRSVTDVVPPRPPEVGPVVIPSVPPVLLPVVPPVGTSRCRTARMCDSWGNCEWTQVCR